MLKIIRPSSFFDEKPWFNMLRDTSGDHWLTHWIVSKASTHRHQVSRVSAAIQDLQTCLGETLTCHQSSRINAFFLTDETLAAPIVHLVLNL